MEDSMQARMRSIFAILFLLSLLAKAPVQAQVTTADLVGTVADSSGAVVVSAQVTATNEGTSQSRSAQTDASGNYLISQLAPGRYTLSCELAGFKKLVQTGIELQVNQRAQINLTLEVGEVNQVVEVEGTAPLLESQSSVLGSVISQTQVQDLPLNGRNFVQLAILSPGVSGTGFGAKGTIMSGTRPDDQRPGSELFVNGNRESSNNYLYDGIDNNDRLTLALVIRPAIEAIKEFKIQTNLFSAEQGRNPGGQIDVVTKSGTNAFHGAAYEFLRNSALDAKNFFDKPQDKIPPFKQNQFGGAVGGPIFKNKTFFFGDIDLFRQRLARTFVNTVPTAKMRSGDFSELLPGRQIYDPFTTRPNPDNPTGFIRDPFPGNIIPSNLWDPVTAKLIKAYPLPSSTALVNNLVTNPTKKQDWEQFDVRVDHQFTDADNFFTRYSWSKTRTLSPLTFPAVQIPGVPIPIGIGNEDTFAGTAALTAQHVVVNWVRTLSPRVIADVRLGFNRFHLDYDQEGTDAGQQLGNLLGVPNSNQHDTAKAFPIFSPTGYTGAGHSRSLPIYRRENTYQVVGNLSSSYSNHTIKTGVDIRRRQLTEFQTNRGNGRFNFASSQTNNPVNNTGGDGLASFLVGAPSLIEQDYTLAWVGIRGTEYSFYVADDWRATSKLTFNLGLRYELDTPYSEVSDRWANFDPATATVLVAGRNGVSKYAGVETWKKGFAPRFGFAYSVASKTVLRGGFGIFYNTAGHGGNVLRLQRHVPFGPIYSFSPGNFIVSRRVSDGFPTIPTVNLASADNPSGGVIGVFPNYKPGYAEQFNLTLEHEISPWSLLLKGSYVGNLGRRLDSTIDLNQPLPGTGSVASRRPFFAVRPNLAGITYALSDGLSSYHAFQFSAEKRLSNGFNFLAAYTFGHSIDNVPTSFGGGADGPVPQDIRNRSADRGNSGFNIRHRFTYSANYQLPFGKGKAHMNDNGVANAILGGWQINGIATLQSGLPFTPTLASSTVDATSRPNRIANGKIDNPGPSRWFDPAAFVQPAQFQYGNAGRNILDGPGRVNFDFSLFKDFPITEQVKVQFRTEFFNVFNTPQFDLPNATIFSGAAVGTITSIVGIPRQIQFGLKIVF
jgi:carboxypeptidase family protein